MEMACLAKQVVLVSVFVLVLTVFSASFTDAAGSCGISFSGMQGCMPSVPKPKVKEPCCKAMRGVDWSCMCFFEAGYINKLGFDPLFAINVAYGCGFVTPGFCV